MGEFSVGDKVRIARDITDQNELYYDLKDEILVITQVITSREQHKDFDESNEETLYAFEGLNYTFYRSELEI